MVFVSGEVVGVRRGDARDQVEHGGQRLGFGKGVRRRRRKGRGGGEEGGGNDEDEGAGEMHFLERFRVDCRMW